MGANDAPGGEIAILAGSGNASKASGMTPRLRKFVGGLTLIVFSLVYYWFAISIALARLPNLATYWHLLFYFAVVAIWFIPSAALIRWVQKS